MVLAGAGAVFTGLKLLFSYCLTRLEKRKWQRTYEAVGPSVGQAPAFGPAVREPTAPSHGVELQGLKVQQVLIETQLAEAQQALKRLRTALDDAERELARKAAELVIARSMYDEVVDQAAKMKRENASLRTEAEINESRDHQHIAADQRGSIHGRDAYRGLPPLSGHQRDHKGNKPPR